MIHRANDFRHRESMPLAANAGGSWSVTVAASSAFFLLIGVVTPTLANSSTNDLTGPWKLLVDDYPVVTKSNVVRTYHPFQKYAGNPVLVSQRPWEQLPYTYGTVLRDEAGTGYRMWYQNLMTNNSCGDGSGALYATSTNGINWTKPSLGQISWCSATTNNMTHQGFMNSVMHTPWETDPAQRYKFMYLDGGGWSVGWSSNGLNVITPPNNPVFTGGGDSGQICWDPNTEQYFCYSKNLWFDTNGLRRRAVGLATTANFTNWPSSSSLVLWPDAVDDRWSSNSIQRTHFYGMSVFPYESMYIGFLWIHRATNLLGDLPGYQVGPIYVEVVSSHDGVNWTREEGDRPAILPLSPGAWDAGMVFTARAPVVEGDTLKIWYGGFTNVHDTSMNKQRSGIGLATMRKDGFASLDAGATSGTIVTKALSGASGQLLVNYHTNSSGGSVKVEVLDGNSNVVSGYSQADCVAMTGNSITQAVTWTAHSQLPTSPGILRLRFIVQNASVYSFMAGTSAGFVAVPAISQQPSQQNVCPGANASFTVAATGEGTITYQWQKNQTNLSNGGHYSGVTTTTLTVTGADSGDVANYRCVVSNPGGSTNSSEAALTLKALTVITQEPSAQIVCAGSNATFTVTATGDGALTYQWQTNGVNLSNGNHYSGVGSATLTVSNAVSADARNYRCVVAGDCGSATSTPTSGVGVTIRSATAITQQPADQSVALGSSATFTVVATGDGALGYQWLKNATNLSNGGHYSGVTTATLTITGADTNDLAEYACAVTGGCGSVTSVTATLSLAPTNGVAANYPVNRAVPDGSFIGVSDTRTLSTTLVSVTNVRVWLKISGTFNGDLFCYVTHGSGYSVLLNRVGRRAADAFGYDDPGLDVTFDDGATSDMHEYRLTVTGNHNTGLGTNVMGTWVADGRTNRPDQVLDTSARPALLNTFTNLDPNGTWTIFVADLAGGDAHTLVSWGLEITGPETAPAVGTIYGNVQLQGFTGTARTVQFVASDGGGVPLLTNDVNLTFAGSPKLADYSLSVPTNTAYVSAKTAWNLRRRQTVPWGNWVATNNFTSTAGQLLGGDISQNNNLVNTADYTVLKGNWLKSTVAADITGDGLVNTADYTILKGNWLKTGDSQ